MNKELEHIFGSLPTEKHYVPNTISIVDSGRTALNVTAGQNANWTYANFFVLDSDSPITQFSINEGQYVVANREGEWGLWDYKNNQIARGLTEIKAFVEKVSEAESLRLSHLNEGKKDTDLQSQVAIQNAPTHHRNYFRAMRTKPFLLLAGISGTGKSRIVKEMAFNSCPNHPALRNDPTSPGNYCLIEVKPNWHDSTELLGYESKIGRAHYQLTPFVKFLAKAMVYPEVPFLVCLDEMNLAPVEQYFAEFLSVLESRRKVNGHIVSEPLIPADIFKKYDFKRELFSMKAAIDEYVDASSTVEPQADYGKETEIYETLRKDGLRIPENVIVVGTVNMDETTHQFSRKVIDRAMTIEMNLPEDDPFMNFYQSRQPDYLENPLGSSLYLPSKVNAAEALEELSEADADKTEWLKREIAGLLTNLNSALEGTPFKIAYRVQNELVIYFYELWNDNRSERWREILKSATDQILMMKVLPRIEGDNELLEKPLDRLIEFATPFTTASKKLAEMKSRLELSSFTSFWP